MVIKLGYWWSRRDYCNCIMPSAALWLFGAQIGWVWIEHSTQCGGRFWARGTFLLRYRCMSPLVHLACIEGVSVTMHVLCSPHIVTPSHSCFPSRLQAPLVVSTTNPSLDRKALTHIVRTPCHDIKDNSRGHHYTYEVPSCYSTVLAGPWRLRTAVNASLVPSLCLPWA